MNMQSRLSDGLKEVSRYPRRAWDRSEDWLSEKRPPAPVRRHSTALVAGLAVGALCFAAGMYYGADLLRYLKMRRM